MTNWIPVTERLPKIGERVLASYKSGDVVTAYRESDDEEKGWVDECQDLIVGTAESSPQWQIVAWMPLSAPYRPIEEDVW